MSQPQIFSSWESGESVSKQRVIKSSKEMIQQVESLIEQALNITDNNRVREEAERAIFELLDQDPTAFFFACSSILAEDNKNEHVRQSAASVMKVTLTKKNRNNQLYWDMLSEDDRLQIKGTMLGNLVSSNNAAMRAGANTIAQIAVIEIVRGEWLEIIDVLAENSTNEQMNIRSASITTLGFICEELKFGNSRLKIETCQQILGSLLLQLPQGGELAEIALAALRESISFLEELLLQVDVCSDRLFEFVLPLMEGNMSYKAYEIMIELGKHCYNLFQKHMERLVQVTCQHIKERSQVSILALEFWDTLGSEYKAKSQYQNLKNYLQQYQGQILTVIMQAVLIIKKSDLSFPELREAAMKALSTFVACCDYQVVQKITQGVKNVMNSEEVGHRQACGLLFSCLIDFPDRSFIQQCFRNGFSDLYKLLDDSEAIVRKNTLNGFVTLSETFPSVFLNNSEIRLIFSHLLGMANEQDEDVRVLALNILNHITGVLQSTKIVSESPQQLLQTIFGMFTHNITDDLRKFTNENLVMLLVNILFAHPNARNKVEMISHCIELYHNYSSSQLQDRHIILCQFLIIIHSAVIALKGFLIKPNLIVQIFQLIELHFQKLGIDQDGINLICATIMSFDAENIGGYFERFWEVITEGLCMVDQRPIISASLSCVSDFARSKKGKISGKFAKIFERLITCMNFDIDGELKIKIMQCLGDICLGSQPYGQMYIDRLIKVSNDCIQAVQTFQDTQSDYAYELQTSMMSMYYSMVWSNGHDSVNYSLADHYEKISGFAVKTCEKRTKDIEYLMLCAGVIFDSAAFYLNHHSYQRKVREILLSKEVDNLLRCLRGFSEREDVREILGLAEEKLSKLMR